MKTTYEGERLAKKIARAGKASRRDAEKLIQDGRVEVDGETVTSPALNVTDKQIIKIDGELMSAPEETRLFRYHKKAGALTTNKDPQGRQTIFELLPPEMPRLISVGRLDYNTEGLLLLTNDGELARHLELPETGWLRRYRVRVHGILKRENLTKLAHGTEIDGVQYAPMKIEFEDSEKDGANRWLVITIKEGKNREVRKAMTFLGLEVTRLIRVSFGPFQLGKLPRGNIEEISRKALKGALGNFFKGKK
ncbi:MAG: pseudouridine synthase [Bdellovibrionales bacterium]